MSIKNLKDEEPILESEEVEEIDLYLASKTQHNSNNFQFNRLNIAFEYLTKFIGIATIFGIIFGGITVYLYLKKINHLFLFPDNISISNASVSIFIVYIIFYIILLFGFLSPFFINIILNNISSNFLITNSQKEISKNSVSNNTYNSLSINTKCKNGIKFILNTVEIFPPALFIALLLISIIGYSINFFNIIKKFFYYCGRNIISYARFVYWSMLCFILVFTIIFVIFSILNIYFKKYDDYTLYFLTFIFIIFNTICGFLFLKQNKLYKNNIWEYRFLIFMIAVLHILPVFLHFLFVIIPTVGVLQNIKIFIFFYIFSIVIFSLSLFFSYLSFKDFYKNKKYDYSFHILSGLSVLLYLFYVSIFSNYEVSLYKTRFIEKPQNSSWYLIHNGNTASETINGMTKTTIESYKQVFEPNSWNSYCKEDVFTKQNLFNCSILNEHITGINPNALYGYMAWNLGNTKVFCPQSVDFFDKNKDNKTQSQNCLVIDGKYLQPISEIYL